MASKKSAYSDLMEEIEKANPTKAHGKFLTPGRHLIKITGADMQAGKKFKGWCLDGEIVDTTGDGLRQGDHVVIMYKDNDSMPSNLKAVVNALGCSTSDLFENALAGRIVRVTATEGTTKGGDPFTFTNFTGFAEEGERLSKPQRAVELATDDDEAPF